MKKKKKIPAVRSGIEVRYAYDEKKEHKLITVSLVKINSKDEVLERTTVKGLHPNAKKKALDTAKALRIMAGPCQALIIDENLMRDEYLEISATPILVNDAK